MFMRTVGSGRTDYPQGVQYDALNRALQEAHFGTVSKTKTIYSLHDEDGVAIGICGVVWYARSCRFTNAFVAPEHRGRGGYRVMMEYRIKLARARGVRTIESCCTSMSVPEFLKRGAIPIHYYPRINQTKVRIVL